MKIDPVADYQKTIIAKVGLKLKPTDIVLDLGCGRGDNTVYFAQKTRMVVGIDIESWQDWNTLKKNNLEFRVSDARKLPFRDDSFNVVFAKDVLHHIKDKQRVLEEIRRVVRKRGRIYLVEANRYNPIFYIHLTKMGGHDHLTGSQFKRIVLDNFKDVRFKRAESRVYPFIGKSEVIMRLIHKAEGFLEKVPFINKLNTYNIAIIRNQ